jgi:hypothetical protein
VVVAQLARLTANRPTASEEKRYESLETSSRPDPTGIGMYCHPATDSEELQAALEDRS